MENKINPNTNIKLNNSVETHESFRNQKFIGSFQFLFFAILVSLIFGITFNSNVDYPRPFIFLIPIVFTIVAANFFDRFTYVAMLIYTNVFILTFQPWEFERSNPIISILAINALLIFVCEMIYSNSTTRRTLESVLLTRGNMLETTHGLVEEFLKTVNLEQILPPFLKSLGEAGDISRTFIYKRIGENEYTLQFEHTRHGIEKFIDNPKLQHVNLKNIGTEEWEDAFENRKIMTKSSDEMEIIREKLQLANNELSVSFAPIFTTEGIWGILGISYKKYSDVQVETLTNSIKIISIIIGALIQREKNENLITNRSKELEDVNKLMIGRELKMAELKEKLEKYEKNP